MTDHDPMGTIELEPTFRWVLDLAANTNRSVKLYSPVFWSTDTQMLNHQWRLEFEIGDFRPDYCNRKICMTVRHSGDQDFGAHDIQFHVSVLSPVYGHKPVDVYSVTTPGPNPITRPRSGQINPTTSRGATPQSSSHTFSKEGPSYRVDTTSSFADNFFFPSKITIVCKICVSLSKIGTDVSTFFLSQHNKDLKKDYEALMLQDNFSNVTICVAKKELLLNKSIISKRSPVFAAMFNHPLKENETNVVCIEDFTYDVMLEFFRYIYAAEVNNIEHYMTDLLVAADKYAVEGLKSLCEKNMVKALSPDNALHYLCMANRYHAKDLEDHCLRYIVLNARDIVKTPEYDLSKVPQDIVNKLFSSLALRFEIA